MGSDSKKTWIKRMNRNTKSGKQNKRKRMQISSPPFPIHPEGLAKAAPAKKAPAKKATPAAAAKPEAKPAAKKPATKTAAKKAPAKKAATKAASK